MLRTFPLALLAACAVANDSSGRDTSDTSDEVEAFCATAPTDVTYDNFGAGFNDFACAMCHTTAGYDYEPLLETEVQIVEHRFEYVDVVLAPHYPPEWPETWVPQVKAWLWCSYE